MLKQAARRLFSTEYMVPRERIAGQMPDNRTAYKTVVHIAWPSIMESVFVTLIAAVDTMMVGGIGHHAITAVGITNQPRFILMAMILSLNVGVTAVVARRKGAGDRDAANRSLKQSLLISMGLGLILSVLGILFARPLLLFAGAQEDVIALSVQYFRIIMIGLFFNSLNLTINAAQRGIGNTKISLLTNVAANVINVIFNYFLINGIGFFPELGVKGAAIATVLGHIVAFFMALRSVFRKSCFLNLQTKTSWRFDRRTIGSVLNVSSSAMVEQVFLRIGFFVYAKMVASLGTAAFATHQICMNILSLSFGFGDGFSVAASSLVGQSLGAKRPDKAILYGSITQRLALVVSTVLFFVFLFGRRFLVGLFSQEEQIIAQGAVIMIMIAFTTHAQTSQVILSGCLRGAGDTKFVAATSFLSIAIVRPILTWLLCFPVGWGLYGAWFAVIVDQFMRLFITFARFRKGNWTAIKL